MKKMFAVFGIIFLLSMSCEALQPVYETIYVSSFTKSNETLKEIQLSTVTYGGNKTVMGLNSIIISSATSGGSITIYDSKGSATNAIGICDLTTVNVYPFNVAISSGLTYTTTGNTNGVTIIFRARQ